MITHNLRKRKRLGSKEVEACKQDGQEEKGLQNRTYQLQGGTEEKEKGTNQAVQEQGARDNLQERALESAKGTRALRGIKRVLQGKEEVGAENSDSDTDLGEVEGSKGEKTKEQETKGPSSSEREENPHRERRSRWKEGASEGGS